MPQLRDSGNHSSSPLDAGTLREVHSFARIFGIETEYGVSVTGADVPCDASQTAMMMFQPIVASARSTNTYIENGSRLYLDVPQCMCSKTMWIPQGIPSAAMKTIWYVVLCRWTSSNTNCCRS